MNPPTLHQKEGVSSSLPLLWSELDKVSRQQFAQRLAELIQRIQVNSYAEELSNDTDSRTTISR